jgi:hypothetical protein
MTKPRDLLIAELSAAATPITRPGKTDRKAVLWLGLATVIAGALIVANGPLRPGAVEQLHRTPRFLFECLFGFAAIVTLSLAAFRTGIPTTTPITRRVAWPLSLLAVWIGLYLVGLIDPALAPSMVGKRAHCWLEAFLYGMPGLVLGVIALRRLWPLHGVWSGVLLGLASGALPALMMQIACMYAPLHILLYHLLPGLALGLVGAVTGVALLRPR